MCAIKWAFVRTEGPALPYAIELSSEGAEEGSVVRSYRAGRLEVCIILTPSRRTHLQVLELLAPYSAAEGIRKDTGIVAWLRWPHWATVDGKVLAEGSALTARSGQRNRVVLRVTVNCSSRQTGDSISLGQLLGVSIDSDLLMERILGSLEWTYSAWLGEMDRKIRERIEPIIEAMGTQVTVISRGRELRCLATRLDEDGSLILDADGRPMKIGAEDAGRVRYRE